MSKFADVTLDADVTQVEEKIYTPAYEPSAVVPTGIYGAKIVEAYVRESQAPGSQAKGLHVNLRLDTGSFVEQCFWITGRNGNPFSEKEGKRFPLPGYQSVESLAGLLANKPVNALTFEPKTIADRSYNANSGDMRTVEAATELLGKEIKVGIRKQIDFKRAKQGNDFVETNEKKESNVIDKFFDSVSGQTFTEKKNSTPMKYSLDFLEQNKDKVFDRTAGKTPNGKPVTQTTTQETGTSPTPIF